MLGRTGAKLRTAAACATNLLRALPILANIDTAVVLVPPIESKCHLSSHVALM